MGGPWILRLTCRDRETLAWSVKGHCAAYKTLDTDALKETLAQIIALNDGFLDFIGPGTAKITPYQDRRRRGGRSRNSRPIQETEPHIRNWRRIRCRSWDDRGSLGGMRGKGAALMSETGAGGCGRDLCCSGMFRPLRLRLCRTNFASRAKHPAAESVPACCSGS